MYGSFQKAIASSKLSYIEKYGFAYEEELEMLKRALGAQVTLLEGGKKAHIACDSTDITVSVRC